MALYQEYTFSDIATFLSDLSNFAVANGWVSITSTSTRVEISKGGTTFRIDYASSTAVNIYATPGGGTISPSVPIDTFAAGQSYMFVSCGNSIYIGRVMSGLYCWGGLINIVDKIGSWSGGSMVAGIYQTYNTLFGTSVEFTTLYRNGNWSYKGTNAQAGSVKGNIDNDPIVNKQPNLHNAAIIPFPVRVFVCNAVTSLLHPIGYAPGLFRINAGNLYMPRDVISVNGNNHLVMPNRSSVSGERDMLFRLNA